MKKRKYLKYLENNGKHKPNSVNKYIKYEWTKHSNYKVKTVRIQLYAVYKRVYLDSKT